MAEAARFKAKTAMAERWKLERYSRQVLLPKIGTIDPYELTVFPDGRVIIKGTYDESMARTLYARYIGL